METVSFFSFEELSSVTERVTEATKYRTVPIAGARMSFIGRELLFADECAVRYGVPREVIDVAMDGNGWLLKADDKCYPVHDLALASILERARIMAPAMTAFFECDKEAFEEIANKCLAAAPGDGLLAIVDGSVAAFLSDGYVPINMMDVFGAARRETVARLGSDCSIRGFSCLEMTSADFSFNSTIDVELKKFTSKRGGAEKVTPIVRVATSNIGLCGANIYPMAKVGDVVLSLGQPVSLAHKGSASLEKFNENIKMALCSMKKRLIELERMKGVFLDFPEQCFLNVAQRLHLPKKYFSLAFADFSAMYEDATCTAYDLYCSLARTSLYAEIDGRSQKNLFELQDAIGRALGLNFKDYDYPAPVQNTQAPIVA